MEQKGEEGEEARCKGDKGGSVGDEEGPDSLLGLDSLHASSSSPHAFCRNPILRLLHPSASLASPATKGLGLSLKLVELPRSSPACKQSQTHLHGLLVSPGVQWAKLTPGRPVGLLLRDVGSGGLVFLVLPTLQAHGSLPQGKWAPAGPGSNANTTAAEQGMS